MQAAFGPRCQHNEALPEYRHEVEGSTSSPVHSRAATALYRQLCRVGGNRIEFGIRADILGQLVGQFHLSNEQVGWIAGTAFWGFTLSMFLGGPLCDWLDMNRVIQIAFIAHLLGIGVTIQARGYMGLFVGTLAIGMGNGFYESAANPLIATLYRENKTERLNRLHVWFPGGIVIGCLVGLGVRYIGLTWRAEMTTILVQPSLTDCSSFDPLAPDGTNRTARGEPR